DRAIRRAFATRPGAGATSGWEWGGMLDRRTVRMSRDERALVADGSDAPRARRRGSQTFGRLLPAVCAWRRADASLFHREAERHVRPELPRRLALHPRRGVHVVRRALVLVA